MTRLARIRATFADWRPVKSRGVLQLVLEVPVEQTETVLETLGAPIPGAEKWVGVALLSLPGSSMAEPDGKGVASGSGEPPLSETKPPLGPGEQKRERTLPELVGMRCNDGHFITWLLDCGYVEGPDDSPAIIVRRECGVASRSEILPGTEAAERWNKLETQYLMKTGRMAEAR